LALILLTCWTIIVAVLGLYYFKNKNLVFIFEISEGQAKLDLPLADYVGGRLASKPSTIAKNFASFLR
ncbi:MAG: hypothetical protein LBM93_13755, partial [Oscillospiraceae bacterium]|nr:hypothetical protein [Oscillospiraceae bacterium]